MTNFQHLIIGGGMVAAAAMDGIGEVDSTGGIGLIGMETNALYDCPLSQRPIAGFDFSLETGVISIAAKAGYDGQTDEKGL